MAQFTKWLRKTVETIVDPDKEPRIQSLTSVLQNALHAQRAAFSLANVVHGYEHSESELATAKERVYRLAMEHGWRDGQITTSEQTTAQWIAGKLEMPSELVVRINVEFAQRQFGVALAQAMQDGVLDLNEEAQLDQIAKSIGCTLPQFVRNYFQNEGEAFLRSIFLACVADNHFSQNDWDYLLYVTQRLGFRHDEMLLAIRPQARQFVEHVLADSKSDGRLSDAEEATLTWLVNNLGLPYDYRNYVNAEVQLLRILRNISEGKLPRVEVPPGIETRAGEIIHYHVSAIWREVRLGKHGSRTQDHHGTLTLTDNRLIFSSDTKPFSSNYRRVVYHRGGAGFIEMQIEGKPAITFFVERDSPLPYAIFQAAVGMANQTKLAQQDSLPSRHIPREVRQRVWQRYGGRCAECNADDYLEFDHVIPVAKGGSNLDGNIQLLCRRCNLKKSDAI